MKKISKLLIIDYIIKITLFSCAFTIFLVYTHTILSFKISSELQLFIGVLNKQGWAFFTKDPREKKLFVYSIDSENRILNELPNSSFSVNYFYGCNRLQRKKGGEFYYILSKIDTTKKFINTFNNIRDSVFLNKKILVFKKDKYSQEISTGLFLFCLQDNIPFAYNNYMDKSKMQLCSYKILVY